MKFGDQRTVGFAIGDYRTAIERDIRDPKRVLFREASRSAKRRARSQPVSLAPIRGVKTGA